MDVTQQLLLDALPALAGEVTMLAGEITTLAGEVATLAGEVTTLAGEVTMLAGEVTMPLVGEVTTQRSSRHVAASAVGWRLSDADLFG